MRRCALNGRLLAPSQKLYEIIRDLKINKYDSLLFLKSYRTVLPADREDRGLVFTATISEKGRITIRPIKIGLTLPTAMDSRNEKVVSLDNEHLTPLLPRNERSTEVRAFLTSSGRSRW
jgi:hypothetical protein